MNSVAPSANRFTSLRIEASQRLLCLYAGLWLFFVVVWWLSDLHLLAKAAGQLLLLGHALWWLGEHYLRCWPASVRCLRSNGRYWFVETRDLEEKVLIENDYLVSTALITCSLRGQQSGRRYALVLGPDSGDVEQLRRLRITLRWLIPARGRLVSDSVPR